MQSENMSCNFSICHGGNGISLSRGTSVHAVSLLTEDDSPLKSKI